MYVREGHNWKKVKSKEQPGHLTQGWHSTHTPHHTDRAHAHRAATGILARKENGVAYFSFRRL